MEAELNCLAYGLSLLNRSDTIFTTQIEYGNLMSPACSYPHRFPHHLLVKVRVCVIGKIQIMMLKYRLLVVFQVVYRA